jgi:hypothetical protein
MLQREKDFKISDATTASAGRIPRIPGYYRDFLNIR